MDSESIWRTYGASLIVDHGAGKVYAGPLAGALPFTAPCFVITAWNPLSEQLSAVENGLRNRDLRRSLHRHTDQIQPVTGQSVSGDWKEESFLVAGIEEFNVLKLAVEFQQRAIFRLDDEQKYVVDQDGIVRDLVPRCQ